MELFDQAEQMDRAFESVRSVAEFLHQLDAQAIPAAPTGQEGVEPRCGAADDRPPGEGQPVAAGRCRRRAAGTVAGPAGAGRPVRRSR